MSLQDELQAAVSARASKTKTHRYSYSDDFNEDEDGKMAEHQNIPKDVTLGLFSAFVYIVIVVCVTFICV